MYKEDVVEYLDSVKNLVEEHGLSDSIVDVINNIDITLEAIKSDTDTGINESNEYKIIKNKMQELQRSTKAIEISIRLEMPLKQGVRLSAVETKNSKGTSSITIPSAKEFYKFAKLYKETNSSVKWNIMNLVYSKKGKLKITVKFDNNFQKEVEEMVK